uniref:Pheromone receptor n=1 Tax=Cyclocybe aegerita TaxID=1973307 RepID=A0A3S7GZZ5_CYCAE|nr:pheromone receptor [Cyclocybe aegerita]
MTDPTYPAFPIFAFLGFFLPLVPLPWHLEALNSGTCFFIMWSSLACLNQFVNSVVWAKNVLNHAPWWCEISIRIMMGASVGIPAASLCINRRLYKIATVQAATITLAEVTSIGSQYLPFLTNQQKHRAILIDSLICVLFPLIYIALRMFAVSAPQFYKAKQLTFLPEYVVQGHRFNLLEDIGCYPALYNTLLTFFISSMWPLLLGLVSAVYCVLSLRSFSKRRAEFGQFISSNTTLTLSRYFRLMALAMTEICATTPLAIFMIWLNATATPIGPWRSWEDTHFAYSRVEQIPAVFWRSNRLLVIAIEFSRWVTPVCSLIFFAFFGFAYEARRQYRLAWSNINVFLPCFHDSETQDLKHKLGPRHGEASNYPPKLPLSPTSFVAFPKTQRAYSFTTTTSTQAPIDFELDSYMKTRNSIMEMDSSLDTSASNGSDVSDAATLCSGPTHCIQQKLGHGQQDPNDTPLPSPWSFASSQLEHATGTDLTQVSSILDIHCQTVAPHTTPLSLPQSPCSFQPPFVPQSYTPKMKTSNGSMRTITSPDRDRFYIVSEGGERAQTPESPRPFASTTPLAEGGKGMVPGRGIQVMVHKTEVRSTEEL